MNERVQVPGKRMSDPSRHLALAPHGTLQRKCACSASGGECAECQKKNMTLQRQPKEVGDEGRRPEAGQPGRLDMRSNFGHDFGLIRLLPDRHADNGCGPYPADRAELPLDGQKARHHGVDLADNGRGSNKGSGKDAGTPAPCCQITSFTSSNDSYADTPTDSKKEIKFTAALQSGADPHRCAMVNWIQGTAKNKDGTFRKVQQFDQIVDYNFPSSRIDSLDKDPVYWSTSSARWNYNIAAAAGGSGAGAGSFSAIDSPGPPAWEDGIDYDLKFKMCAYCIDDVSATSDANGSGVKNPLRCVDWAFKAKYDAANHRFSH